MAEEYVSGNGGYIEARAAGSGSYTRYDNTKWVLRPANRLTENTHSGTLGSSNFEKVVNHNEWNVDIPLDINNYPEDGPLGEDKVDLLFHVGDTPDFYDLRNTSVETGPEVTDDNAQDIVRTTVSGKGGALI